MKDSYDVIVVGGGIAGCSAALSLRRKGLSVLVLEKLTVLGGLATTGHIAIYLPLDDGFGHQVISGISEELLHLSTKYAFYAKDPKKWKEEGRRYECKYNGPAFSLALEELLLSEDIDILYDTLFVGGEIEGNHCRAVYIENKSGRSRVEARGVIDASGDADLFQRVGAECVSAKNNLAIWAYFTQVEEKYVQKRAGADASGLKLVSIGKIDTTQKAQTYEVPYFGNTGEGVNKFIIDGHQRLLDYLKSDKDAVPASLPGMAQIRTSRRIAGAYELSDKDAGKHFEDNIGGTGDWRKAGPVYEIPYRCLYSTLDNVLAAGRCISTSGEAWEIIRCIPQAALTGEVAGTALAMALEKNQKVQELDITELRERIRKDGNILDVNKGE